MSLVLVSVIGADKRRVDYASTMPPDIGQNFLAIFQAGMGEEIGSAVIERLLDLPWVASTSHQPTEVVLECRYDRLSMPGVQTWEGFIDLVNAAYEGLR